MKSFTLVIQPKFRTGSMIKQCEEFNHIQQVAFSTHHNAITQVCFTCEKVRTSIKEAQKK